MRVVEATHQHVDDAIAWMVARGVPELPADLFPPDGYVVEGVAALWIYLTKSSIAYLEMLVSNPKAPKEERDAALDAVIDACVERARSAGCRTVMAPVQRADIIERATRKGFLVVIDRLSLIARPLGGD